MNGSHASYCILFSVQQNNGWLYNRGMHTVDVCFHSQRIEDKAQFGLESRDWLSWETHLKGFIVEQHLSFRTKKAKMSCECRREVSDYRVGLY